MSDNDILTMFMHNKALLDEIRILYSEKSTHQERSIDIGDAVVAAMDEHLKTKLKEHQAKLCRRLNVSHDDIESEKISFDSQRLM